MEVVSALRRRTRRPRWSVRGTAAAFTLLSLAACVLCFDTSGSYEQLPYVRLPLRPYSSIPNLPDKDAIIISVDAAGRTYVSHTDSTVQTVAIRRLAARHGVHFTAAQLAAAAELPYLGTDVRQLPAYLARPRWQRRQLPLPGLPQSPINDQVMAGVLAARSASIDVLGTAPYLVIRADEQASAAAILGLIHRLQRHNLNRYYFMHAFR